MDYSGFHLYVLGIGHLAAAVRVQLRQAALLAAGDVALASADAALFLACSDSENASQCAALGERVRADRGNVLFACLTMGSVRVGPLVAARVRGNFPSQHLTQSWDLSLSNTQGAFVPASNALTPVADTRGTRVAQIGATVVIRELENILRGAGGLRLAERVAEKNPPSRGSEISGFEAPNCFSNKMLVASAGADCATLRRPPPLRVWHPAALE